MSRSKIFITGKVTRVGFRNFIKKTATDMGLVGTVQNVVDPATNKKQAVEVIVEGDKKIVGKLIRQCTIGPSRAKPKNIIVSDIKNPDGSFTEFSILK